MIIMVSALLVDLDSTIPNLALMKIATMVKTQGGTASFSESNPTHAYISCIFDRNRHKANSAAKMIGLQYPDIEIDIGGSGYDLHKNIPEIETLYPDYEIYPEMTYSLGFTTRGCIRKCSFCVVPEKEGKFKIVQHPEEFYNDKFRDIVLLDNNILADLDWFFEVTEWILEKKLRVDFNQGLDIRLLNEDVAKRLCELRNIPKKSWKFAFDDMKYKDAVLAGIDILKEQKVNTHKNAMFYVYLDSDKDFEDALKRCNILRENGTNAFLMINQNTKRTKRMTDLKTWCRPWCYWATEFSEFDRRLIS